MSGPKKNMCGAPDLVRELDPGPPRSETVPRLDGPSRSGASKNDSDRGSSTEKSTWVALHVGQ